jgi:hypothetical protein
METRTGAVISLLRTVIRTLVGDASDLLRRHFGAGLVEVRCLCCAALLLTARRGRGSAASHFLINDALAVHFAVRMYDRGRGSFDRLRGRNRLINRMPVAEDRSYAMQSSSPKPPHAHHGDAHGGRSDLRAWQGGRISIPVLGQVYGTKQPRIVEVRVSIKCLQD